MKELKAYIYNLLSTDVTLQGLLGSVDSDKRIYHIDTRVDYEVNEKKKGFITLYSIGGAQTDDFERKCKPPETFTFDIYAISFDVATDIFERLDALLINKDFNLTTYRIANIVRVSKIDGMPSDINAKRITVSYRFQYIIQ